MKEFLNILSIAIALSMDTFSLSLSLGTYNISYKKTINNLNKKQTAIRHVCGLPFACAKDRKIIMPCSNRCRRKRHHPG